MNFDHLRYYISLVQRKNFQEAADYCHISQPALSQAIKRIEEEIGVSLLSRTKRPLELTVKGMSFYHGAKKIIFDYDNLLSDTRAESQVAIQLKIGIIPTLSTYLLPLFLGDFAAKYPKIKILLEDVKTEIIIDSIKNGELDAGILAFPVDIHGIIQESLFYEEFLAYSDQPMKEKFILPSDLESSDLWILEEGHCLRSQVLKLCDYAGKDHQRIQYMTGSIETLINLVDSYKGTTIIPELASLNMPEYRMKRLSSFCEPVPVREIGLVYHKYCVKRKELHHLKEAILNGLPSFFLNRKKEHYVVDI